MGHAGNGSADGAKEPEAWHDLRPLESRVQALAEALGRRQWRLATAESCTGGLIAAACTAVPGSSDWFDRGFVTYSNAAKTESLGVDADLIARYGAVSEPVALAMATGTLQRTPADLAVAVTGIAGPTGGSPDKPVGLVWMAVACRGRAAHAWRLQLAGDRAAVRGQSALRALDALIEAARPG
jgi:nicotinamide-nucleotide amidase